MNIIPTPVAIRRLLHGLTFSLICSTASAGLVVEANGALYDIDVTIGLLSSLRPTIESQPWYSNSFLAGALADAVGDQLGTQQFGQLGPMFGFQVYDGVGADYTVSMVYKVNVGHAQEQNAAAGISTTYAIGKFIGISPVPEPPAALLAMIGALVVIARARISNRRFPKPE